jgi:hypothetical protein
VMVLVIAMMLTPCSCCGAGAGCCCCCRSIHVVCVVVSAVPSHERSSVALLMLLAQSFQLFQLYVRAMSIM